MKYFLFALFSFCSACNLFAPECGDGVVDLDNGEFCDDGNNINGDGCEADCQLPPLAVCQNNIVEPGEFCFAAPIVLDLTDALRELIVEDLDNDGFLDIAGTEGNQNFVRILFGKEDSLFEELVEFSAGSDPHSLSAGDFTGDGQLDIIVSNKGSDDVSLLVNQGARVFAENVGIDELPIRFLVENAPENGVAADLNDDGILDYAVTNLNSASVSILFGDGKGSFGPQEIFATESGANAVIAVDIDEDNDLDLVVANAFDDSISVLDNDNNNGFLGSVPIRVGNSPNLLVSEDFNQDGILDIATTNVLSRDISLLFGEGNNVFAPEVPLSAGNRSLPLATTDLNNDDIPDLVSADEDTSSILVFLGVGDGSFEDPQSLSTNRTLLFITLADLNKDQVPDIVAGSAGDVVIIFSEP